MTKLRVKTVALSLGLLFAILFVLCVLWDLVLPQYAMLEAVAKANWLPGFGWPLSFGGFVLGLVESFVYGLLVGVIFVPLYNYFDARFR